MCFLKILYILALELEICSTKHHHLLEIKTMSDFKEAIDKTEELARKIWLAGLGAYGQGLDNVQDGYDKMNEQTRRKFDDLVGRGEKIEAEAKEKLDEAKDKLKNQGEKLKKEGEKLRAKGEQLKDDALNLSIADRLDEIRNKVSEKLVLPELPKFGQEEKIEDLTKRLEELTSAVTNLLKGGSTKAKPAAKKAPAKKAAAKLAAKKPAAKKVA